MTYNVKYNCYASLFTLILTFIFMSSVATGVYAQKRILTLEEAITLASTENDLQKQYDYVHETVRQQIKFLKADYLPTLHFRTFVSHANEAPRIPVEFENETVLARQGTRNTFVSRFELNQVLYDFGKTRNHIQSAHYQHQLVDVDFNQKEFELTNKVRHQFYLSLYYQQLDSIYSAIIPYAEELAQINRERLNNGVALPIDVLKAQVDLQDIHSKRIVARSEYRKTLVILAYMTGQETFSFDTVGQLPSIPEEENLSHHSELLYLWALQHRQDIQQLKYQSQQQEYFSRSLEALKYPTLMLQSDFSYFGPDAFGYYSSLSSRGLDPFNWRVGIGFTYTLFDGSRVRSQKSQSHAMKQQYREMGYQLEEQIWAEIQTLLEDLEILRELEKNNSMLLQQFNANVAMMEGSYKNGGIPRVEYMQSIIPKAAAEAALEKTRSDMAQILGQLERTVGTDISNFWKANN